MSAQEKAWLDSRKKGVGASEAAALFGCHPYLSEYALWANKTGHAADADNDNERTEDGKFFEPRIADRFQKATGLSVTVPQQKLYQSVDLPTMMCSPDRFVGGLTGRPLELKWWDHFRAGDDIPLYGQIQVQQQTAVLRTAGGFIAILGSFRSFHHFEIERNQAFIELLIEKIDTFWTKHVLADVPPTADGSHATAEAIKRLYPKDLGTTIFLPPESQDWADELAHAKARIKDLAAREDEAENKIKAAIGKNTFGYLPDGSHFSLKQQKRAAYTVKEAEFRVLRRVEKKL